MNRQARREVPRRYFSEERLAEHHFRSPNAFLECDMMDATEEKATIETNIGDKEGEEPVYAGLGGVRVETSRVREADGSEELSFLREACLRNITCPTPVFMKMSVIRGGEEEEEVVVDTAEAKVDRMPIMVGSSKCNIAELSDENLVEIGEDPVDPSGYFIVNDSERVPMIPEDLTLNRIPAKHDTEHDDGVQVVKAFSQRRDYHTFVLCERNHEEFLEISFPSASGGVDLVVLVRALSLKPDERIVHRVSDDSEIVKFILESLKEAEVQTQEQAVEALDKRVVDGQGKSYQFKRANCVIGRYLLPHLHEEGAEEEEVRTNKAYHPCRMVKACFELTLQHRDSDDRNHYVDKCPEVSGDPMKDSPRTAPNKLTHDVKYQSEHANMRSQDLTVNTVVRSGVLTERLEHPIATGNWVGGRSGASQLIDRTDYMGVPSHLHRLRSPLSRLQLHFEARDLHAAQWGCICPSGIPEGLNCGLVKNFAQVMKLFQNVEDEQSPKRGPTSVGTEGIPGIGSIDAAPADD